MDTFSPQDWGYKASEVNRQYGVWVIANDRLPVIIDEGAGAWYCPITAVYEQDWVPQARAMFG